MVPSFIKRREQREWVPGHRAWYWIADAPCGQESVLLESSAIVHWTAPDKIWCSHAQCDMCQAVDHTVSEHSPETNWLPVLWCNAPTGEIPGTREGCDGVHHKLDNFRDQSGNDCYAWYQGNYPNGWVYWQGDWRCGQCAEKTIFGARS
jgi:hypothetical protein